MSLNTSFPAAPVRWKALTLSLVAGGLLLAGCQKQQQAVTATPPPEVTTFTVATESVLLTSDLPGRTSPYRIAEIRPQVNGLIQERLFVEGSDVKAGQPLYQIDPAPFQAAADNALAALRRAEANLPAIQSRANRYTEALNDRAVSQQDYDDANAALQQALADIAFYKATLETAKINLGYAKVISPIDGRIGTSSVTVGAIVTAYQPVPLATIQQLDPIYVDVPQSATELLRLRERLEKGQIRIDGTNFNTVRLTLPDGSTYSHEGTLQFRDVSVDPTTGTVTLRMVFPNPDGVLLPGMFVRASIKEGVNKDAILIPQQSVARDPKGNPMVMLVDAEGKVQQRRLTLDRSIGDRWLVSEGLAVGDRVILEGIQRVRAGMQVTVIAPNDTSTGSTTAQTKSATQHAAAN
jgi:RND family efflux transporter, MFP subunit